jgi:hypothetical protein
LNSVKRVEFRWDDGADLTVLGTDATLSLRLKKRHMQDVALMGDYRQRGSIDFMVPGFLKLTHLRDPLARWSKSSVYMLNFVIPAESFRDPESENEDAEMEEEVESLLGQNVIRYLRATGREEKALEGEFNYEYWDAKPNQIDNEEGGYALDGVGTFIPEPIRYKDKIVYPDGTTLDRRSLRARDGDSPSSS